MTMFILLDVTKETAQSLFFEAQHKENDTYHTIEIDKSEIQKALSDCGHNPIPKNLENRMREFDCILDICQDIVRYSKEWYLLGGVSKESPKWQPSKMYHNAGRFWFDVLMKTLNFYPKRGELLIDGVIVKGFSARVN